MLDDRRLREDAKQLALRESRSESLRKPTEVLYLKNTKNGRVFPWSAILAMSKRMVDCDAEGNEIDPRTLSANHPYMEKAMKGMVDNMRAAGAGPMVIAEVGQYLKDQADSKASLLGHDAPLYTQIEHKPFPAESGWMRNVDRRMAEARSEINMMCLKAYLSISGHTKVAKPFTEVAYPYQKKNALRLISSCS